MRLIPPLHIPYRFPLKPQGGKEGKCGSVYFGGKKLFILRGFKLRLEIERFPAGENVFIQRVVCGLCGRPPPPHYLD